MSDIRLEIDGGRPRSARWVKLCGRVLSALVVATTLAGVLLPTALSTGVGTELITAVVNRQIAGRITVESLSTGWFSGLHVRGLRLEAPGSNPVFENFDADDEGTGFASLLRMAWVGRPGGLDLRVRGERVQLTGLGSGGHNLAAALSPRLDRSAASVDGEVRSQAATRAGDGAMRSWREKVGWAGSGFATPAPMRIELLVAELRWRPEPQSQARTLTDLEARADTRSPDRIRVHLRATSPVEEGPGVLDVELTLRNAATPDGVLRLREAGLTAQARLESFPLAFFVEPLMEPADAARVAAVTGSRLSGTAVASGSLLAPELEANLQTQNLQARLGLRREGTGVAATDGSGITWRMTPEGFAAISDHRWRLERDASLRLDLEKLVIAQGAGGAALEWASLRANGQAETLKLTRAPAGDRHADRWPEDSIESLTLGGGRLRLLSDAVGRRVELTLAASAEAAGGVHPGGVPVRLGLSLLNARMPDAAGPPTLRLHLEGFPTQLLELAGPRGEQAARLLGPELGLQVEARQEAPAGRLRLRPGLLVVEFSVASQGVRGPITVRLSDAGRGGVISTPEPLRIRLDNAAWPSGSVLGSFAEARLHEPVELELDLRGLSWLQRAGGGSGWAALDPSATGVAAVLRAGRVVLRGRSGGLLMLGNAAVDLAASEPGGEPELFAHATVLPLPASADAIATPQGSIRGNLRLRDLLDGRGLAQPEVATWRGEVHGEALPSRSLDGFLGGTGRLQALLGPTFSSNFQADKASGQPPLLTWTLQSDQAIAGFSGRLVGPWIELEPGGQLQVGLTRAGADALRGRLHPLTLDLVRSVPGSPLVLTARPGARLRPGLGWEGWLPLFDEATLWPGRLELRPDGWLAQAAVAAVRPRVPTARSTQWSAMAAGPQRNWEVQGTPTRVRLEGGVLAHSPLWLVGEDLAVGLQGQAAAANSSDATAPAENEAARVEMVLGLPGASLQAMDPSLRSVLPAAVYQLAVSGWIDRPQVDADRFAADLLLAEGPESMQGWRASPEAWDLPPEVRLFIEAASGPGDALPTPDAAR